MLGGLLSTSPATASTVWRKPATTLGFSGYRAEMQRQVDAYGTVRMNRFCAVVRDIHEPKSIRSEGNRRELVIYWPQGATIYTYGPSTDGPIGIMNQDAGATIDLANDVVPSSADLHGSTVQVTRADVDAIIRHCRVSGTRFTLIRHAKRP